MGRITTGAEGATRLENDGATLLTMFRTRGWRAFGFCFLLVSPALLWIALDRAPFGGDPSYYAGETVSLFDTLVHSPLRWPSAMAHALGIKAPGIAWIGQLFVPLGALLGSIDAGLLLSIAAAQLGALLLTFRSLRLLAGNGVGPAVAGCLVIASTPLSVQLVHEFLVETLQMMATAYFILILALAPRWPRARVLAHLLLASALGLLAKASSPLFCFAPGLLAFAWALAPSRQPRPWAWSRLSTLVPLIAGSVLALATLVWYDRNLDAVRLHMATASSGTVALYWGKDEPFIPSLTFWLGTLGTVLLGGERWP